MSLALSGCSVGPHFIRENRTNYNTAVQMTAAEEMLLNLVRVRYGESPAFLAVGGITSQFEVSSTLSAGGGELRFGSGNNRFQSYLLPSGELGAADRPTTTLLPLQDQEFTRRFLSPVSLDTIYLFTRNGRRIERMLRMTVEQINGVRNSPHDFGSEANPGAFVWLAETLGELGKQQQIELSYEKTSEPASPSLDATLVEGQDVVAAVEQGYRFEPSGKDTSVVLIKAARNWCCAFPPLSLSRPRCKALPNCYSSSPDRGPIPWSPPSKDN